MTVCFCCLNIIEVDQMVLHNSHEVYHRDCFENLTNIKNKRKLSESDLIDVSDCLVIDTSKDIININYKKDVDYDKPIGKFIDLISDKNIYYNDKKYDTIIKNILLEPDYASDIAGNLVKIDKNYVISN